MARKKRVLKHTCATLGRGGVYLVGTDCECTKRITEDEAFYRIASKQALPRPGYDNEIVMQLMPRWRLWPALDNSPEWRAVRQRSILPFWGDQGSSPDIGRRYGK